MSDCFGKIFIPTKIAARMLRTSPNNLAQYSHRLSHVCERDSTRRLWWPADIIAAAAEVRALDDKGCASAIESVADADVPEEGVGHSNE